MATVDDTKAQKILMYLWANGFKATNLADGVGTGIGADVIQFLKSQGHTVTPKAQNHLLCDNKYGGTGIATSTFSTLVGNPWVSGSTSDLKLIADIFGLSRDDVDTLYSNAVLRLGVPVPAKKGGAGRSKKAKQFNRDGWSAININAIAETGSVDANWTKAVKDNASGATTMDVVPLTNYVVGSGLGSYGKTIPTVSPAGVAPAAPSVTSSPPAASSDDEEEEEEESTPAPATPAPPSEFENNLETEDLSVWWKDGLPTETIETSEREVSSKAWTANGGKFDIGDAPLRVRVLADGSEGWSIDYLQMLVTNGDIDNSEMSDYMSAATNTTLIEEDGDEWDVINTPSVSFFFEKGEVYIEIEGFGMVRATRGGDFFDYSVLEIVMDEPSAGGLITDIQVDKTSFKQILKESKGVYGFPYDGIEGLENRFKSDNYTDEGAGNSAEQQALRTLSLAYTEGYRKVTFEPKIESIDFNKETLPDDVLQPLALNFDTELDLEKQAVFFVLDLKSSKDATNLFPGFNINDNTDNNREDIFFPFDIRYLRPINESGVVLDPKNRELGEGVVSIEVDSSNGISGGEIKLGSKTYSTVDYSQIRLTIDGGESILIPDLDENFQAIDNQSDTLRGVVGSVAGRPALRVVEGKLDIKDIEKYLTATRRSSRLSKSYNAIDELTRQVNTKSIMIQQDKDYYIIVESDSKTYAIKIRGE